MHSRGPNESRPTGSAICPMDCVKGCSFSMPPEPTWAVIAMCSAIFLVAATITSFSGFGFALFAVPLLSLFLDLKFVVPLVLLAGFFSVIVLSINKLQFFKEPTIIMVFIGMTAGTVVGTHILVHFETGLLKRILGMAVALFAVHVFFHAREQTATRHRGLIGLIAGIFSGIAGGIFGTSGPPLVVYLNHFCEDKTSFRSQILVLFLLHDVFRFFLYLHSSLITAQTFRFGFLLLPPLAIGLFVGSRMHFQVGEKAFNKSIAVLLFISGLLLLKP
jgi:uncharacterized membrane protein YfcA